VRRAAVASGSVECSNVLNVSTEQRSRGEWWKGGKQRWRDLDSSGSTTTDTDKTDVDKLKDNDQPRVEDDTRMGGGGYAGPVLRNVEAQRLLELGCDGRIAVRRCARTRLLMLADLCC
jgi:hypothetical protein